MQTRVGPLFFGVLARPALWGGTLCHDFFGYDVPDNTGQVWAFAAQPDGDTPCIAGLFQGKTLGELWVRYPELFQSSYAEFPFIISLVAPVEDLSVQVHPTIEVARTLGYEHGKNEAWLMLDSQDQASLIYGLTSSVPEAVAKVRAGEFKGLFRKLPTHTGEFFYIPAGTVHALGAGNMTYEVQQATNVTFRMYDYDRVDANGKARELDIDSAIMSIVGADSSLNTTLGYVHPPEETFSFEDASLTQFIQSDSFVIASLHVDGAAHFAPAGYLLCTVIQGSGAINGVPVRFADNVLLPACMGEVTLEGSFTLAITAEGPVLVR